MERIPKSMRFKIACTCLTVASLFKFAAKMMMPGIIVESFPLPGWFIVDLCIIKHSVFNDAKIKGFEWRSWGMPDEYCNDMRKVMRRINFKD